MSQTPLPRPSSKPKDFKARFGVVPDAPPPKLTRLQVRRAKRQRFRAGAVIFALLLGTAAGGTFLIAQDFQGVASFFKSRIAGNDGPVTAPPATPPAEKKEVAAAPSPPPAPAETAEPADMTPPPAPAVETPAAATPEMAATSPPPAAEAPPEASAAVAEAPPQPAPAIAPPPEQIAEAPVVEEPPVAAAAPLPPASEATEVLPETEAPPPADVAPEAPAAAVEPVQPAPPPQPVTEAMQFPGSPVVTPDGGAPTATVTANETAAVETVTQQGQSVPLEEASPPEQVAMAAPPAAAPVAASGNGAALVQGQVFRDCENCPDLVVIVPPSGLPAEQVARVKRPADAPPLTSFALGRFEITFDDWARCMAGGGCTSLPSDENWGRNTRPVINVSFEDASAQYVAWLSRVTGAAYRLPTAAEWDFAEAGGGVATAGGVPLIDAQTICQSGNYASGTATGPQEVNCADGFPSTAPVGSLKANALGLNDMRGNVWEWVSDCWTPGFTYKVKDSERDCRKRLLRGGAWSSRATLSAIPARGFEDAKRATKTIGFRVARSLP